MHMKQQPLVTQRIVYERVSKEDGILKVYMIVKMPSDLKPSWTFVTAVEAETRSIKLLEINVEKKERINKETKNFQSGKNVLLESASKVADAYGAKLYRLKKKKKQKKKTEKLLVNKFMVFLTYYRFCFKGDLRPK